MIETDLKDFEDYLAEFNSALKFDAENCPICGINLSNSLTVTTVPLIELQFENEIIAERAIDLLESGGIKSKKSSSAKERILIPEEKLEDAKIILKA